MQHIVRAAIAVVVASASVFAQGRPRPRPESPDAVSQSRRSDSAFASGNAPAALDAALGALKSDSNDAGALWRAARSEVVMGILTTRIHEENFDARFDRAIGYGRRAVTLEPNNVEAHFWLAAALGRRAMHADFALSARRASEAYAEAQRAIAFDSTHAGAQALMGKLHSELRKLPWVVRVLASTFTGLPAARAVSWQSAESHLRRAIALDPALLAARVDLAELYLRMGRRADAVAVTDSLLAMKARTPLEAFLQTEARRQIGAEKHN
jgi:tetratricopeptide (TPR) repeat protein